MHQICGMAPHNIVSHPAQVHHPQGPALPSQHTLSTMLSLAPSFSTSCPSEQQPNARGSFKNLFAAGLPRNTSLVFDIEVGSRRFTHTGGKSSQLQAGPLPLGGVVEEGGVKARWRPVCAWLGAQPSGNMIVLHCMILESLRARGALPVGAGLLQANSCPLKNV